MRLFLALSALNGFLAVAFGAFGAHGLRTRLSTLEDGARRLEWWTTASTYQLAHALALGLVAMLIARAPSALASVAGFAFLAGIVLFSGSLYLMTVTGLRALGAVTPLGGLAFLVGWACLLAAALRATG